MNIKRNITFSLERRKKNGIPIVNNVPIRMRVTYARNRIEFTTGYRIDVAKWDGEKQRVRNGCSNKLKQTAADINADLNDYYTTIQTIFKEFEVQDIIPEPEQLKEAFSARFENDTVREWLPSSDCDVSLRRVELSPAAVPLDYVSHSLRSHLNSNASL